MAANFNLVPPALLGRVDRYAEITARIPTALPVLIITTLLLLLAPAASRHGSTAAQRWAWALRPLAPDFIHRFKTYLDKATYPNRAGAHGNTAFALMLAQEYAAGAKDKRLAVAIRARARG